ncbi:MAG: CHAT domain-containing protein [Microcystis aeruginosa W13-18]|nr:CHAT domain-containing protein [Microcystis aeruginosa W13-18]
MAKLVTVKLGEGNWEQGFPVILQIAEEGSPPSIEVTGKLPSAPEIPQNYDQWQSSYRHLPVVVRLTAPATQITNVSTTADCRQTLQTLQDSLKRWLNSESFRPVRERLLENLNRSEPIRFIIQAGDGYLRRLPWNLIEFFDHYPKSEVAIAAPVFEKIVSPPSPTKRLRILAILGHSEGIDVTADRRFLENLPGAETVFLVEPPRQKISEQLWEQHWDILFFAGHSHTEGEVGRIYINQRESLTIGELKHGLRTAIEGGLQLAIFNSCDGLGLAKELENLQIPQAIVMREPVPDKVAQEFLKHFLKAFSRGKSLYLSVRTARERLAEEGLDTELPGVMGLPVICQNPAAVPIIWQTQKRLPIRFWIALPFVFAASMALVFIIPSIISMSNHNENSPPNRPPEIETYQFHKYGISIKYPRNWQLQEGKDDLEGSGIFVKFSPDKNDLSSFPPRLTISLDEYLIGPPMLDDYVNDTISKIINQQNSSIILRSEQTTLANNQAHLIEYTWQDDLGFQLKSLQFLMIKGEKIYRITYTAENKEFPEFLPLVTKVMINSFQVELNPNL